MVRTIRKDRSFTSTPVWDRAVFEYYVPNHTSVFRDGLVADYLTQTRPVVDFLIQADLTEESREMARLSHRIRSSTQMLGLSRLAYLFEHLELAIEEDSLDSAHEFCLLLPSMAQESFNTLEQQLKVARS